MKKWVYFVLVFLSCWSVCCDGIFANCTAYRNIVQTNQPNPQKWSTTQWATIVSRSTTSFEIGTTASFCNPVEGVYPYDQNSEDVKYMKTVCNENGSLSEIACDSNCTETGSGSNPMASCISPGKCLYTGGGNYYQDWRLDTRPENNLVSFDNPTKFNNGQSVCFGNVKKTCNEETATFESPETCKSNETCINHSNGDSFLSTGWFAVCEPGCTSDNGLNVKAGEIGCKNGKLYRCSSKSKWDYEIKFSDYDRFNGKNCYSCIQNATGPDCLEVTKNPDGSIVYDKVCTKISENGVDSSRITQTKGGKVCSSDKTQLYVCDGTSEYYQPSTICTNNTDGRTQCGTDGNTVGCMKPDDTTGVDQSIVTTTITISTDTGFMCDSDTGVWTAFGCIPITASGLANKLLPILFGIAGGISFLRMVLGFIMMATSSGDEKKFIEAKSVISSAIIGLLVSIFAIFLFRLIFVNILQIPGLS